MKIAIIGCGNMGLIYARAFLKYDIVSKENLLLAEKNEQRKEELKKLNIGQVTIASDPQICMSDLIIIAVKPQDFPALSEELKKILLPHNTIISIMAGITIATLKAVLGTENVVRAMPNSPAELGMGMTGFTCTPTMKVELLRKAEYLLSTTGRCIFLEDESLLDAVTALSGSGPAYFFYIVKHMIEAAKQMGIEEPVASIMVKQTMHGAYHLINNSGKPLDDLILAVASKGGTTEAALSFFNENRLGENLISGILKARQRAKELSR
jgi:pyrroline-5-carboxylate reductase